MAMLIFPSAEGINNQYASSNNATIGLNGENTNYLKVNAVTKVKVKVKVKVRYKRWYRSHGKWRYKWRYKYVYRYVYKSVYKKACSVGAYNVVITPKYVYATGKNSCAIKCDYKYHTRVFYNYNPRTKRWGTLKFEQGPAPRTSPEGMWYDSITDMDFCLVHGKSHDSRNVYLKPYNGVINGVNVVNGYFTTKVVTHTTNTTTNSTDKTNATTGTIEQK